MIRSGSYPAEIVERSSEEPTTGDLLWYTVRIYGPDFVFTREQVKPQPYDRAYWESIGMKLVPFDIGQRLQVTIIVDSMNESIDLTRGEWPETKPCEDQGDPDPLLLTLRGGRLDPTQIPEIMRSFNAY